MEKNQFDINQLSPFEVATHDVPKKAFIDTLVKIHRLDEEAATGIYDREARYYEKALTSSDRLQKCSVISLYSVFLELAITGLSIQPGSKAEAFLEARSSKQGEVWLSTASLAVSAYGELNMRIRAGQIIRMSNPIVIYDGDHFQPLTTARGELTVDYKPAIPRRTNTIVGCWVAIHLPGNGIDFKWLLATDITRLQAASARQNKNTTGNALYASNGGQIDPGFLEAKTIKHAMRSYTKLRVSDSVSFEDDMQNPPASEPFAGDTPNTPTAAGSGDDTNITGNDDSGEDIF